MIAELRDRHRERKHFARAAFVRTTGVSVIPSTLQRLHGFGYNGIVRIHLSTWLVLKLEGSVHSVPRDVTLPSLDTNQPLQDFSQDIWDTTIEECESKQWLEGPFTVEQLDTKYPDGWIPCRRFAVWQREKWRPIDDFSENSVNSCYSVCDKIDLKALDETVWTANYEIGAW